MLQTKRRTFGNIVGHAPGTGNMRSISMWIADQFDPTLNWDDIKWIRDRWGGKLILKGILDPDDAERALETGADAMIVSNHGGRQLDGALSSIAALPSIVATVSDRMEIFLDGGVRSGQDVLKAVALGARAVFIGRAFLYGVQALGGEGVTLALDIIRKELDLTMALCGYRDILDVGRRIIDTRDEARELGILNLQEARFEQEHWAAGWRA
jgi:L-lactate dehydrogenase (cytochrome)